MISCTARQMTSSTSDVLVSSKQKSFSAATEKKQAIVNYWISSINWLLVLKMHLKPANKHRQHKGISLLPIFTR